MTSALKCFAGLLMLFAIASPASAQGRAQGLLSIDKVADRLK